MNKELRVNNFKRFEPLCIFGFTFIIVIFFIQSVLISLQSFVLILLMWVVFMYWLYRTKGIKKATLVSNAIKISYRNKIIIIPLQLIEGIDSAFSLRFNLSFQQQIYYIIRLTEKFPFGSSITLMYPLSENEPQEITELKGKWTESIKNNNSDQP